ncbi:MAG: GGDEF domain-containing protein [Lachnospiraceae bacterium]|nr:GGDEF domain-containing protein [Lachnospiraceae bacterium]
MGYGVTSLEKRLKENIKDYRINNLFQMRELQEYLKCVSTLADVSLLLTERHGERAIVIGDFIMEEPNVVENPGRKLRVFGRTIGHLYTINNNERPDRREHAEEFLDSLVAELAVQATEAYKHAETALYADELEVKLEKESYQVKHGEKEDRLTGVLNKNYFENRVKVIERSEVIPVAVICVNINDWKYVNDLYGEKESDRLIKVVADILQKEASPEYVIGRVDGDAFEVLIPIAEAGEAEKYCKRVQASCNGFVDPKIAPSVACGFVMKTNVEQTLAELYSDAEYEMFQNKYDIKHAEGYKERLQHV